MASDVACNYDVKTQCDIMDCTMCKQQFKNPRTLPCLHTFCRKCLRKYIDGLDGSEPKCPLCGNVFPGSEKAIDDSPNDVLIKCLLECENNKFENQTCSLCGDNAIERCFDCNHFLCDQHSEYHRKLPSVMSHILVSLQEYEHMPAQDRLSLCSTKCLAHEDYTSEYFCSTCDTSICLKCTLDGHDRNSHSIHNMDEVIETDKKALEEEQRFVVTQYKKLTKAEKKIFETREKLMEAKEEALKTITMRSNELRKRIDTLENELADDITAKYNTKLDVLDKQMDAMDRHMNELDVTAIYINALLQCKNTGVFLDSSKKWYEQFKKKKPDYLEVETEPIENSYIKVEVDEKPIEEAITAESICCVFCTSAVACHSQLIGCPENTEIGYHVKFSILIKNNDNSKAALNGMSPDVKVTCPSDHKTNLNGETTSSQCKFKYDWYPSSLGKHTISACIFDNHVKGSPMVVNVYPKNSKGHQQQYNENGRSQNKYGSTTSKYKQPEQRKVAWKK